MEENHTEMQQQQQQQQQQQRSKATDLFLREDWSESIKAYTQYITTLYDQQKPDSKHRKSLCLALTNRAEARLKLKEYPQALMDCDEVLDIDEGFFKGLVCKGKIFVSLGKYSLGLECFERGLKRCDVGGNLEMLNGLIDKCRKLDYLSKSGNFDVSNWVSGGFVGKFPELCEFFGCVEIKRSSISGRGLFCTRNIDVGTLVLVAKSLVVERCILPSEGLEGLGENAQLVMWKNFVEKVGERVVKCVKIRHLVSKLSSGEDECELEVPDVGLFRDEFIGGEDSTEKVEMDRILSILDVNSIVEEAVSSNVLGRNRDYYGVGLWLLPSFINHSCVPNVRRVHVGDYVAVVASRDVKAGEEFTFAYYDVLSPLSKRKEMAKSWGFQCRCKRCKHEEQVQSKPEFSDIEIGLEKEVDPGCTVFRLEECLKRCNVRGKDKGYLRASFWKAFSEAYESEKTVRRWGRKIPALEAVVDSLVEAVGSDERVVKVLVRKMKKCGVGGTGSGGFAEMERVMKLGRGVYGKIMKKQAMRILLELGVHD